MNPERSKAEGARDWKTFSTGEVHYDADRGSLPIQRQEAFGLADLPVQTSRWLAPLLVLMSSVTAISMGYMLHERAHAAQLSADNRLMSASLAEMRREVDSLNSKVNKPDTPSAPAVQTGSQPDRSSAVEMPVLHPSRVPAHKTQPVRGKRVAASAPGNRPQPKHQQKLETNQVEYASGARPSFEELNGSIARNHEELVGLEQRGERNYFEFDLARSKRFERIGPLGVSLRRVNSGHQRCHIEVLLGDNRISKKDLSMGEPLLLYPEGSRRPVELVVNRIGKDKVHGYVSAPKYSDSELGSKGAPAESPAETAPSESQLASKTDPEQGWGVKFRKLVSRLR